MRRGRAFRRVQREKRKRLVMERFPDMTDPRHIGIYVNTRTPCSCPMCGNPRRHFGQPTVQERRLAQ